MTLKQEIQSEIVQPKIIRVSQQGVNILILSHVGKTQRFDGKNVAYRLEHRWLSDENDCHSVRGNNFTFWSKRELNELNAFTSKSLFDCFNLY